MKREIDLSNAFIALIFRRDDRTASSPWVGPLRVLALEGVSLTNYHPRMDNLDQRNRQGRATSKLLLFLAILVGLASVAFGIVLVAHATYHCGFDPSGNTYCDPAQHPWEPVGFTMMLAGIATAGLLVAVGKIIQLHADTRYLVPSRHEFISDPL